MHGCRHAALLLGLGLGLLAAAPSVEAAPFTLDGNADGSADFSPADDELFSLGNGASGTALAVDYTGLTNADIESSTGTVDFTTQDVLFFAIALDGGSSAVSQINVSVGTDPANVDPQGIGWLKASVASGDDPDGLNIQSGGGVFPGAGEYLYGTDNLLANENTRILFATWSAGQLAVGQTATFMVRSGTDDDFQVLIVPEPTTAVLLALGVALLAGSPRRRE